MLLHTSSTQSHCNAWCADTVALRVPTPPPAIEGTLYRRATKVDACWQPQADMAAVLEMWGACQLRAMPLCAHDGDHVSPPPRSHPRTACSTAMIPAAATRESVSVDLPARQAAARRVKGMRTGPPVCAAMQPPARPPARTMVHVSNDGDVTDVVLLVHESTDLRGRGRVRSRISGPCAATAQRSRCMHPCTTRSSHSSTLPRQS
jgi:hypothetical protein